MLSHRNLLLNAFYVGECQKLTDRDRICIPVPFYHCFGCVLGTICAVVHGAAMIVPAESFDATATLEAIEQERATALYGVPTMFIAQLHDPSRPGRDLSSLRTGIMAGSPCPIESCGRWSTTSAAAKSRSATARPRPRRSSRKPAPTIRSSCAWKPSAGRCRAWK